MQEQEKEELAQHVRALIARLNNKTPHSPDAQGFAEVYIEDAPDAGGGEAVIGQAASVRPAASLPPADPKRALFFKMRRLAQSIAYPGGQLQRDLFYRQARFMEHFEDDYEGNASFSMYFPSYQMMGYEQLRTYFSWRSKVRRGVVAKTSFSYVFVYIYELINNVGVQNCEDGLCKLAFIWQGYRGYEKKLDQYMNVWVRDYYITNAFTAPFEAVIEGDAALRALYTRAGPADFFEYYLPCSDYKVKQSRFFSPQTEKAIAGCFNHVIKALDAFAAGQGAAFDELVFYTDHGNGWTPFAKALYCPASRNIRNKLVRLSDTETYRCENGRWTSSQNRIVRENGRALIGYILRRIEQFYRRAAKYRYRLTADRTKVAAAEIARLFPEPARLFAEIDRAIVAYYRLSRRTVVTVDAGRLETIRANAQKIQEKLLAGAEPAGPEGAPPTQAPAAAVPEGAPAQGRPAVEPAETSMQGHPDGQPADVPLEVRETPAQGHPAVEPAAAPAQGRPEEPAKAPLAAQKAAGAPQVEQQPAGGWDAFVRSLDAAEKTAVRMVLRSASVQDLRAFAQSSGMMLEVLADNINQKALEAVGDTLFELGDEVTLYEDYRDALEKGMDDERQ